MKAAGALILFSALFLPWYTLEPDKPLSDFGLETAWEHSVILGGALTVLALLALRWRIAGAAAGAIVVGALVFAPSDSLHRDVAPWLALLGALIAALDDPKWVSRLGIAALLALLLMPWYYEFTFARGSNDTQSQSLMLVVDGTAGPSTVTTIVIIAIAQLSLIRPQFAWLAIGVVLYRLIEPSPDLGYGAYLALVGSILAWTAGLLSDRPKITDQCSPATRSSTSPASPASS